MTLISGRNVLLRNARIVLRERVLHRASLLLQDGRIAKVFETTPQVGSNEFEIDLEGLTLFPGFIDLHIHGAVGVDTLAAQPEDLGRVSEFLSTQGVTAWLPTLVPASLMEYEQSIESINGLIQKQHDEALEGQPQLGARALGVHYEGPFVSNDQCGALHEKHFRTFSGSADIDALPILANHDSVHLMTLAPEIAGGVELVAELNRRGWIVSIGHTRADFAVLDQALAAGAHHMTHFMNAMVPLHHRSPGPVAWGLLRDEVTCDIIADGVHLDRHVLQLLLKTKGAEGLMFISDAIAAAGKGDGDYQIWGETITVKNGRTSNTKGHIAGSVISMLDAVRTTQSLGVSEIDLALMAAINPARLLGVDQECGSIEEGKRADLVALDSDGSVVLTMIGGAIAFDGRNKSDGNES